MKILGNAVMFVTLYLLFMMPTYFLPYVGSNSAVLNAAGTAAGEGLNPALSFHFGALVILIVVTWFRGTVVDKKWLIVFPVLAAFFDLMPGLSYIPLVPTVMHLFAVILGVVGVKAAVPVLQQST